jgi:hypothetical protein
MQDHSFLNSIYDLTGHSPQAVLQIVLRNNLPITRVINALFASLSQMSVSDLLTIVESSNLVSILKTIDNIVKSGTIDEMIAEMSVEHTLREMFSNFADGEENLIAVIAMLVLMKIPTNDVAKSDDEQIEALKLLFRSTLFHNDIVIHFMGFRDEFQQRLNDCPCVNCNSPFILSIGWYIAAQGAHDANEFAENSEFLIV